MPLKIDNKSYVNHLAWLPDSDAADHELEESAVEWITQRARAEGKAPIAFTKTRIGAEHLRPPFSEFVRRYGLTYQRDRRKPSGHPVLALFPDAASLSASRQCARGSSLMVVESHGLSLHGWAAATGATDITGIHEPMTLIHPDARKALDSAIFFGGGNNWTGRHEREDAADSLRSVVGRRLLSAEIASSYVLGHGRVTEVGAKKIASVVSSLI